VSVELITRFYTGFQRRDAAAMGACYAPDVRFSDPVFPDLRGDQARAMWQMLCERGKDLKILFSAVTADATQGSAHWEAWYTFSGTGRPVHNVIEASFTFSGGRITTHADRFDFYGWTRQALGVKGTLFGWTPFVQNAIRAQGMRGLARFTAGAR
jgi:ketosteroid isomerase-like protein